MVYVWLPSSYSQITIVITSVSLKGDESLSNENGLKRIHAEVGTTYNSGRRPYKDLTL